jgi:hypothetical protein
MSTEGEDAFKNLSREEIMSALFANLVFQNTNMAIMFMGRVPHPETGERMLDLQAARMFIDQLEMLQVKTQGNLDKEEEKLLQQSLAHVRIAFVETVEKTSKAPKGDKPDEALAVANPSPTIEKSSETTEPREEAADSNGEARKRYSKNY